MDILPEWRRNKDDLLPAPQTKEEIADRLFVQILGPDPPALWIGGGALDSQALEGFRETVRLTYAYGSVGPFVRHYLSRKR